MAFEGYIVRIGKHWGASSLEWAGRRMAYRGLPRTVFSSPHVDILVFGSPESCVTDEGVMLFATEFEEAEGVPFSKAYRDGHWCEGAAQTWRTSMMLAIDAKRGQADLLIGEFCESSRYYASVPGSFFFAPEIKAFSNVRTLKHIIEPESGARIFVSMKSGAVKTEILQSDWPQKASFPSYEAAVIQCRELMERNLDNALEQIERPFAVSFSGGIDSSILVHMLARRRFPIRAFCVWFDDGSGVDPLDLKFARRVAEELDFELNEIRVDDEQLARYLPLSLYYGERSMTIEVESAIYYLPLLETLREHGYRAKISGDGCDAYFAGYHRLIDHNNPIEFRQEYLKVLRLGWASHIGSFHDLYGIELCEPFASLELLNFGLGLPREYLMMMEAGEYVGKVILRDAYRGDVPDYILDRRKGVPSRVNGTTEMIDRVLSGRRSRSGDLKSLRRELLKPARLRFAPRWAVRAGWFDRSVNSLTSGVLK